MLKNAVLSTRGPFSKLFSWYEKVACLKCLSLHRLEKEHLVNVFSTPKLNTPGLPLMLHEYGESSGTLQNNGICKSAHLC